MLRSDKYILGFPVGLGLLAFVHLLADLPAGMLPIVLLYQREALDLSLGQVGLVAGTYNFCLALAQPLFGYLADRYGARRFAASGVVWQAILVGAIGFASSFSLLFAIVGLAAVGSAAFHPSGFAGAGQIASAKRGTNMSIFLVGGSLGHALGPLVAGAIFQAVGLQGTVWIALGLLLFALGPIMVMPLAETTAPESNHPSSSEPRTEQSSQTMLWLGAIAILTIAGVRTWIHWSSSTYIPQQLVALGFSPAEASGWLALFLAAFSIGILAGGPLADYLGDRSLLISSFAGLAGMVTLLARPIGLPVGLVVGIVGLLIGFPLSMIIVIGQSLIPKGIGLASGLVLGGSFVVGATGVTLTGIIADRWGLESGFTTMSVLALIAMLVAIFLPKQPVASQT